MNMTNKQMAIVVQMIYDKVNWDVKAKEKEAGEKLKEQITSNPINKKIKEILDNNPLVDGIEISWKTLIKTFPKLLGELNSMCGHTFKRDCNIWDELVKALSYYINYVRKPNFEKVSYSEIEQEVVMSALSSKDLQVLIDTISKKFLSAKK